MAFKKPKRPSEQVQKQQLVDRLIAAKLQKHADALLAPTVWLDLEATDDELDVGSTRFGGLPDLPAKTKWPMVEKNPLFFVGQFDLASLSAFEAAKALPSKGLLSFFLLDVPRGEQLHCGEGVVLYTPATAKLVRRELPEGWDDDEREPYATCRVHLTPGWMLPNAMEPVVASTLSTEERGRYSAPSMASGHYPTHLLGHRDHNGYSVQEEGLRLRLLLQLNSDDELGAQFGDVEDVDWFIHEGALAKADFSKLVMAGGA